MQQNLVVSNSVVSDAGMARHVADKLTCIRNRDQLRRPSDIYYAECGNESSSVSLVSVLWPLGM